MALTRYSQTDNTTEAAPVAPEPVNSVEPSEPAAGTPAKDKSKDTYLKIKLSADKATPDTWFKLIETKTDGLKMFKNERSGEVAFLHPSRSAVMLYTKDGFENYFHTESKNRNNGLLGRFYVNSTQPTPDKPEPRLYMSGKYHSAGLVNAGGELKVDAVRVFGGIVGFGSKELLEGLKGRADNDRARAAALKTDSPAPAKAPDATPRVGDDLEFGM